MELCFGTTTAISTTRLRSRADGRRSVDPPGERRVERRKERRNERRTDERRSEHTGSADVKSTSQKLRCWLFATIFRLSTELPAILVFR